MNRANVHGGGTLEEQVRGRIESLSYLPTTAAVAMKFVELGKNPEADPAEYAKVIGSDSSLSTKLLALANSSWFGVRNRVTKPLTAVNLLGLGTVRTLAISYCLTGLHNDLRLTPEESRTFWSASLCKAVAAKQYVKLFEPSIAEEAFTAGLFSDFAMPIMYAVSRSSAGSLFENESLSWCERLDRERELFRLDHAEIGRMVAQRLELPELFVDAIGFHHNQQSLREFIGSTPLAEAVYVGSLFPHVLRSWNRTDAEELSRFVTEHAKDRAVDVAAFLDGVQAEFNQLYTYFENGAPPEARLTEMLEIATREIADNTTRLMGTMHELLREAASAGKEMSQILRQHDDLREAAFRDGLTGALNRQGFMARAQEWVRTATENKAGFAIAYIDIDRFKQLNDTRGHHFGDAALKRLVEVTTATLRPCDFIGRVGGDEFAFVIVDCEAHDAARAVHRVVTAIAADPISHGPDSPRISVSAGLVWVPAAESLPGFESLLGEADELMYQSKRAGGCRATAKSYAPPKAA